MIAAMLEQNSIAGKSGIMPPASERQARDSGLSVRLATSRKEVDAAQALRYRVFFEETNGRPSAAAKWRLRDSDIFDRVADHLLVFDPERGAGTAGIVGTVRLLRGRAARSLATYLPAPGFAAAADFNIEPLLKWSGEIVELGRPCIDPDYRSRKAAYRLWQGIAAYLHAYNIGLMFGTEGFPGSEPIRYLMQLAYLHHTCLAPPELRPHAFPERFVDMDNIPAAAVDHDTAWRAMPAELKDYLQLGAMIGHGAVVNGELGTLDVCLVVCTGSIPERHHRRYRRWLSGGGLGA